MGWTKVFEDLAGQVAVITGGARGLGLNMARALARWGVKIALLDVLADVKNSAETVQRELGVESLGVVADVTDDSSVAAAFADVSRGLGSPSILINAAGITLWEVTIAEALKSLGYATALFGKWHLGGLEWQTNGRAPTDQGFDEWYGIPMTSNEAQTRAEVLALIGGNSK